MVWLQEKPKRAGYSPNKRRMRVPLPTPEGPEMIRGRRIAVPSTGWSKLLLLTLLVMPLLSPLPLPWLLRLLLLPPRVMRCRRAGKEEAEAAEEEKLVPLKHAKPDDDEEDDEGVLVARVS